MPNHELYESWWTELHQLDIDEFPDPDYFIWSPEPSSCDVSGNTSGRAPEIPRHIQKGRKADLPF